MNKSLEAAIVAFLVIFSSGLASGIAYKTDVTETKDIGILDNSNDRRIYIDISCLRSFDKMDLFNDPDLYIKVRIDDEWFTSPVFKNKEYVYDCCSFSKDLRKNQNLVNINIQVWEDSRFIDRICDISKEKNDKNTGYDVNIVYDYLTGRWSGDDCFGDTSGYGRLNGCDDGSIYENERDCELFFDIYQTDVDGDSIPSWVELNVYGTNPLIDNSGEDLDFDGIPIEWEHRWGFNPYIYDDFKSMDPDCDSIDTYEEYLVRDYGSDPFRADIFMEMDFMETGPDGEYNIVEDEAFEILKVPFHRRNYVYHVDNGQKYGGDLIPYDENSDQEEVIDIYENYFIKDELNSWKRGIFHYAISVNHLKLGGYAFRGDITPHMGYTPGTNSFVISTDNTNYFIDAYRGFKTKNYIDASSIMHEMGHNFGLRWGDPFGVDCIRALKPWRLSFWIILPYRSIMNYQFTYNIFDYSDGDKGRRDNDDWEQIDLSYFEKI